MEEREVRLSDEGTKGRRGKRTWQTSENRPQICLYLNRTKLETMNQINLHPLYRRHNIDSAMSAIVEFYKKNFLTLFIIAAIMAVINQFVASMINIAELQEEFQATGDITLILEKMRGLVVPILIISLVNLFFTAVLQHYIIFKPIDSSNTIFVSLVKSLRYYIPLLVIMILLGFFGAIALVLGIIALVIGAFFAGLYIMTLYLFIMPVMMVEGPDIGNTIGRTFRLAHKDFWTNIGWVAVFLIILIVISVIASAIILLPFTGGFLKSIFNPGDAPKFDYMTNPVYLILSGLLSALTLPLMPIFGCVLYFNARAGEEERKNTEIMQPDDRPRVEDLYAKPYADQSEDEIKKELPEKEN